MERRQFIFRHWQHIDGLRVCGAQLLGEDAAKTSHFASYLREVFLPGTEMLTMEVAAATLGHLVKSGGALTADIVEFEVAAPDSLYMSRTVWAQHQELSNQMDSLAFPEPIYPSITLWIQICHAKPIGDPVTREGFQGYKSTANATAVYRTPSDVGWHGRCGARLSGWGTGGRRAGTRPR